MNRICIFGAGAVGGHIAARLARAGLDVSVVVRGPALAAIQSRGLRLVTPEEDFTVRLLATDRAESLGPQDLVICTVKAHGLPAAVDGLKPLLGPDTPVVFAINGLPWWYSHGVPGMAPLTRLDPDGRLWREIGPERALGGVVVSPNEVSAPGVVRNNHAVNAFTLGEPGDAITPRLEAVARALGPALPVTSVTAHIRSAIWNKLLTNLASSPLAALADAAAAEWLPQPRLREVFVRLIDEGAAVARALGVPDIRPDVEHRENRLIASRHPPSFLQDLRAGRPVEIDAQMLAVQDVARQAGVATPVLDSLVALLMWRLGRSD
jgi:2-dehydropantoate 2-reductase